MLTQKCATSRMCGHVVDVRAGANTTMGGSSDSELKDWQVMPCGVPSAPTAVITVIPEQNAPSTSRNCVGSTTVSIAVTTSPAPGGRWP